MLAASVRCLLPLLAATITMQLSTAPALSRTSHPNDPLRMMPQTQLQFAPTPSRAIRDCHSLHSTCSWQLTAGSLGDDQIYAVARTRVGDFVVAGHTRPNFRARYDGWIMYLSASGDVLWERTLGGPDTEQIYGVVAMDNGDVVAAGHTRSDGAGESDFWVVRLDYQGNVIWERTLGSFNNDQASALIEAEDGGVVVTGFTSSRAHGERDAWIVALDANGRTEWDRIIANPGTDVISSIALLPSGDFAVAGHTQTPGQATFDFWVLKLRHDGEVDWRRQFHNGEFFAATSVAAGTDGSIFVAGLSEPIEGASSRAVLMHLSEEGNPVWRRDIGGHTFNRAKGDGAWALAAMPGGDIVVVIATASQGAGSTDARLARFSPGGTLLWEHTFGGSKWDYPTAVVPTLEGGLLIGGITTSSGAGYEDGWLVRLDRRGKLD